MHSREPVALLFGGFRLELRTGELTREGVGVKLQQQPARVLIALARRPGELVTRAELRRLIWGEETFVAFDQGLNFCVKQVRAALGDDAGAPRFVETLHRRGYRFVAEVRAIARDEPSAQGTPPRTPRAQGMGSRLWLAAAVLAAGVTGASARRSSPLPRATLAVLPFANLDAGDSDLFSDGLTEETIHDLGALQPARLGVIARTSTMTYKGAGKRAADVGRELRANYVLEGTVRRFETHVLVNAELIRVQDLGRVWAQSYEAPLSDELRVQSEVAERIATSVGARLVPDCPDPTPGATRAGPGPVDPFGA